MTTAVSLYKVRGGIPVNHRNRFLRILKAAVGICGLTHFGGTINVVFLPLKKMAELNWSSLRHEGATDVITFDLRGQAFSLESNDVADIVSAEIYVCPEVALNYAQQHGLSSSRELVLYAIHGMLHLSGQDDIQDNDRAEMRRKEGIVMDALSARGFSFEDIIHPVLT